MRMELLLLLLLLFCCCLVLMSTVTRLPLCLFVACLAKL